MTELKSLARKEWLVIIFLAFVFILVRIPGIHSPLHQDEYKWLNVENLSTSGSIPHPPLGELIYHFGGTIVGFNTNFRMIPVFFGLINLFLLYYLVRFLFGKREAVIAVSLWIIGYFSILASLMVDTDGEIMPFFFLLSLISYFKLKKGTKFKNFWWTILILAMLGGMLIKLSFILAIAAIVADFIWSKRKTLDRKLIMKYFEYAIGVIVFFIILLFIAGKILPFFNLDKSFVYWKHFFTTNRGWFQTLIQCAKAILYSSPLLVLVPIIGWSEIKNEISKIRVFLLFLVFSFIFYVILFDFSIGALDRYLQLLVLPLTVMTSIVIVKIFNIYHHRTKEFIFLGIIFGLIFVILQSVPHYTSSLYPKSAWITRALFLRWNFVYPFSGGSGPFPFYVSFLFIALCWLSSIIAVVISLFKPEYKKLALMFVIPVGIIYNCVFIEEYFFGYWNGNGQALLHDAVEFIKNDPNIAKVVVYNDNGGWNIQEIGKYDRRLYIDPKFGDNLNRTKPYFYILDIPHIDEHSLYQKYFNTCKVIYNKKDKYISSRVYDCNNVKQ